MGTELPQDQYVLSDIDSLDAIKSRITNLKSQNEELSLIKEYYLAKGVFAERKNLFGSELSRLLIIM